MDQNKALRVKGFFFFFLQNASVLISRFTRIHPSGFISQQAPPSSLVHEPVGYSLVSMQTVNFPILMFPPPLPEMLHPHCLLGEVLLNFQDPTSNVTSYTESTAGIPQDFGHTCKTVKWFSPCLSGIKISQRTFQ